MAPLVAPGSRNAAVSRISTHRLHELSDGYSVTDQRQKEFVMPLKFGKPKMPKSLPRKNQEREMRQAVIKDAVTLR
jgi:hypothetical protein